MKDKRKVVVVGIDAADFELIQHFVSKGILKNFKKIITTGAFGPLKSTIPPFTAPAWTSFFTGVYPEKHGIYDFVKRKVDSYDLQIVSSRDRKIKPIWSILSENGKKIGVVNVPMTYPPEKINGIMISGFPFSSKEKTNICFPGKLMRELEKNFGEYEFREENIGLETKNKKEKKGIHTYLSAMEKMFDISLYMMKKDNFDLFITEIQETDSVQHNFWNFWDDKMSFFVKNKNLSNCIEEVYQRVDEFIGAILERINGNCTLIIVSDHGFGRIGMYTSLSEWLVKNNFLKAKKKKENIKNRISKIFLSKKRAEFFMNRLKMKKLSKYIPDFILGFFLRHLTLKKSSVTLKDTEWEHTKAYSLGYPQYIYINLKDREPQGIVDVKDYKKLVDKITRKLRQINTIDKIFVKRGIPSNLPDISFTMKEVSFFDKKPTKIPLQPGHRQNGIFIAYGKDIKKGKEIEANIVDIVPTILHIFDIPVPSYIDGRVLKEIFAEDSELTKRKTKYRKTNEEEKLEEKIKNLKISGKL